MMLNDYTYMIEVERHRDAIDFAERQRKSHLAGPQDRRHFAWLHAALARLQAALHGKQPPVTPGTHSRRHARYHHGHAA